MREVRIRKQSCTYKDRITPAYAGSTQESVGIYSGYEDHPRVCGKYNCNIYILDRPVGSPPRMREVLFSS